MAEGKESKYPKDYPIPPDPVSTEKLNAILSAELTSWRVVKSPLPEDPFVLRTELFREFEFEDFDKVLDFMTKVGVGCNIFPHHPRWENIWTSLKVWLSTWDSTHVVSYKDILLARHMELIFSEFSPLEVETRVEIRVGEEQSAFVRKIKELIGNDNLDEVFNQISVYNALNTEKGINDDLILLTQRYRSIRKAERNNIQSHDVINQEIARISKSLLDVLALL